MRFTLQKGHFGAKSETNCNPTDYTYLTKLRARCAPCTQHTNIKAVLISELKDQEASQSRKQKLILFSFCILRSRMMKLMKSKNFQTRNFESFGAPKKQKTQKKQLILFSRGKRKHAHGKPPWLTTPRCVLPCNIKAVFISELKDQEGSQWTKQKLIFCVFCILRSRMMKLMISMKSKNFKTRNFGIFGASKMQKTQKVQLIRFSHGNRKSAHGKHPWLTTPRCDLPCKSIILVKKVRPIVIRRITRIWQSSGQGVHHVHRIPISRLCW